MNAQLGGPRQSVRTSAAQNAVRLVDGWSGHDRERARVAKRPQPCCAASDPTAFNTIKNRIATRARLRKSGQ
jgi:hypothetical protein